MTVPSLSLLPRLKASGCRTGSGNEGRRARPVVKKTHVVWLSHSAFFVTVWFGVAAGICVGDHTASAEASASVTIVAEGMAPFLKDMSLDEVRGRARDEARRNAIEQAVGVFVRSASVLHNSQITDELIS